jgi:hypothetical protein
MHGCQLGLHLGGLLACRLNLPLNAAEVLVSGHNRSGRLCKLLFGCAELLLRLLRIRRDLITPGSSIRCLVAGQWSRYAQRACKGVGSVPRAVGKGSRDEGELVPKLGTCQ